MPIKLMELNRDAHVNLIDSLLTLCVFSPVCGDVVYLYAQRNSSIEFSCQAPEEPSKPFAFSLSREWLHNTLVLYHNFQTNPTVRDDTLKGRIMTHADVAPRNKPEETSAFQRVNVSMVLLQGGDTDMYTCMFHYNTPSSFKNLSGKNKIFLYVKDSCKYILHCCITSHKGGVA